METEILKLLGAGGGGVALCVAMLLYFIRYVKDSNESWSQKYEASLKEFRDEHTAMRTAYQTQIQAITDRVFAVVENTTSAIKGLEGAVRELQNRIK